MNHHKVIAIDLAKSVFQVCIFDKHMKVLSNKSMRRAALLRFLVKQSAVLVAIEACGGEWQWGRTRLYEELSTNNSAIEMLILDWGVLDARFWR